MHPVDPETSTQPSIQQHSFLVLYTIKMTLLTRPLPHLLVCLEDVLRGHRADSCPQGLHNGIGYLCAHAGGIGVQDTEVALVTLHHQVQRAPLRVHAADVCCTLFTPPSSTCTHTQIQLVNLTRHTRKAIHRICRVVRLSSKIHSKI